MSKEADEHQRIAIVNEDKVCFRARQHSFCASSHDGVEPTIMGLWSVTVTEARSLTCGKPLHSLMASFPLLLVTCLPWLMQCKPKKCKQECKRSCPVVLMGAFRSLLASACDDE